MSGQARRLFFSSANDANDANEANSPKWSRSANEASESIVFASIAFGLNAPSEHLLDKQKIVTKPMVVECYLCACVMFPLESGLMQNWHLLPVWQSLWCLDIFISKTIFTSKHRFCDFWSIHKKSRNKKNKKTIKAMQKNKSWYHDCSVTTTECLSTQRYTYWIIIWSMYEF